MVSRIKQRVWGSVRGAQNKKIVGRGRTIGGWFRGRDKATELSAPLGETCR